MSAPEDVCSLLLAAGTASRFGSLKQLQRIDGVSLVRRAALTALTTGTQLFVVTGAGAGDVRAELLDLPVTLIHNADWAGGMGTSLACGVRALERERDPVTAVLIQLADQPLVSADDLRAILHEHATYPSAIIASDHGEVLGPPCLFAAAYFGALAALTGDRGARALMKEHRDRVRTVAMPHALVDVDTPQDLARAADLIGEGLEIGGPRKS
ncbi:MAG: nucleotidyltransferase family protein [Panacagrimonas sp.]